MAQYTIDTPQGPLVVEGPEGASQDQVFAVAKQLILDRQRNLEDVKPDYTMGEAASKAFTRGTKQMGSALFDIIPAMGASALGFDDYAKKQMEEAQQTQEEVQKYYAPEVASYKDVNDISSGLTYGVETVAEQIPNLASMFIPGGVGAAVGRRAGLGIAERELASQLPPTLAKSLGQKEAVTTAQRLYGDDVVKEALQSGVASGSAIGGGTGLYLGAFSQNAPEVFQNIYDATGGQFEPGAAVLAGGISSVLDTAMPAYIINKFKGPSKALFIETLLEKSGMKPGLARKAISILPEAAGIEGLTEGAQEAISIQAEKYITNNQDKFSSDEWNRVLESGIRGAVAGLGFGLPTTVASRLQERGQADANQVVQDILNQPSPQPDVTGVLQNGDVRSITEGNRADIPVSGQSTINQAAAGLTDTDGLGDDGATTDINGTQDGAQGSTAAQTSALTSIGKSGNVYKLPAIPEGRISLGAFRSIITSPIAQTKNLFRQLSPLQFNNLLMDNERNQSFSADYYESFVTDNKDLALGQDKNKNGIQITFRPNTISGKENVKPGTQGALGEVVGKEYVTDAIAPKAIESFLVPKNQLKNLSGLSERLIKEHFDGVKNADGSYTFTRRMEATPITETKPSAQPTTQQIPQAAINAWNKISRTSFSDLVPEDQAKVVDAHKANALDEDFADELDQYYEESRQPTTEQGMQDTGETSDSITDHLVNEFGNNVRTAQNRGTLKIVNNADELSKLGINVAPNAVGAYSKGTSYIIANRLNKDNARRALLHEVGEHHGLEGMLGKDLYKQVLRQVRSMNTMDPAVTAAHDHVNKQYLELKPGTDAHTREVLARIGETAPENSVWRRVVGAVKNFLTKMGLYNPNKMTTADIHDLILHSTRTTLKRGTQKLSGAKVETQEMRAAVPPSGVNQENAKNLINSVGQIYTSLPKYSTNIGKEVRNVVSRSPRWFQQAYLSFLSLPQKIELYGKKLPALNNILVALEQRASMADKERSLVDKLVFAGKKIIDSHPRALVDKWNKIVLKLSADEIDPRDPKNINNDLVRNFHALPKDLQDLAIAYTKQYETYSEQLISTIQKYSSGAGNALLNRWKKHKQPFYHPLRRQGEYWVSYKDKSGTDIVIARKSPAEIKDIIKAAQAQGGTDFNQYTKLEKRNYKDAPPGEFVSELMAMLQSDLANKGMNPADIESIKNEIYNSYLDLLPAGSIKQQMREREGTSGYIEDVVGGFADLGSKMANQLSNLEYRPQIDAAVADLNGNLENYNGEDKDTLTNVVQDIYNQKSFLDNPIANNVASQLGFVSYMWNIAGNISSALVNTTQLAMAVFPMLAGRYGYGKAFGAMTDAFKMYYNGGQDNNRVYMPDLTFGINPNISKDHKDLYDAAIEASAIRRGPGYELSEMRRQNASDFTGTKAKIETGLSWIFQNTERMNREVTLLAAYDLARANGMTHPAAIKDALDLTMKLHSHALSEAGPRIMQDGIGKVAFTFKRFAQAQIYNTARLFYQVFKDADPETRKIARKQLLGIYGMTYVFSGAQGLPVYGAANMLSSAIAGMFGDDEPYDFDEEVREAIGDLGYKGPMNKLLGVDIASRTGFNGMIWRTDNQRLSEVGFAPYFAEHFFGPAYQVLAINPVRAAKLWGEGYTERSIETIVPAFVKNPMKAFRMATEGATTKDGVKVIDEVGPMSSFFQIWGFTNSELAEAYTRANSMKQAEKQILNRKSSLINLHYLAKMNGDQDMLAKVKEDIANFNKSFPGSITLETIRRSEAQHQVRLRKSVDGVYLNKKYAEKIKEEYGN